VIETSSQEKNTLQLPAGLSMKHTEKPEVPFPKWGRCELLLGQAESRATKSPFEKGGLE